MTLFHVVHYRENNKDIFQNWLDGLRDYRGRKAVINAVDRMQDGNFGVHRFCRDDVWSWSSIQARAIVSITP